MAGGTRRTVGARAMSSHPEAVAYSVLAGAAVGVVVCLMAGTAHGTSPDGSLLVVMTRSSPVLAPAPLHTRPTAGVHGALALDSSGVRAAPIEHRSAAPAPAGLGLRLAWPSVPGTAVGMLLMAAAGTVAAAGALRRSTEWHPGPAINSEHAMLASAPGVALLAHSGRKAATPNTQPRDQPLPALPRRAVLAMPLAAAPLLCPSRASAFLPTFPDTRLRSSIDVAAEARFLIKRRDGRSTLTAAEEEVLRAPVTQRTLLQYGNDKARLRDSMVAAADAARAAEQAQLEAVTRGAPQRGSP